ncbi:hypothetical protein T440DRAFT_258355 [Plenodomus tracheiphilus IPT5]|uniref:Tat pathway signal sequence n=1 Tax=Plenodomus tracheiphilus IPT5 TaxID=1408161 RepID=A0A6A7ARC5_9PLEO|nr:hypothetical protein T440DRAFT_258355 [Plenodomus tracheiphilus IPT5]
MSDLISSVIPYTRVLPLFTSQILSQDKECSYDPPFRMQLFLWSKPERHQYDLVQDDKDGRSQPQLKYSLWLSILKAAFVCLLAVASFFIGRETTTKSTQNNLGFGKVYRRFEYNRTFGEPPSELSDAAWASLFPKHGGFFVHPELAPKRSAFSVFHQMHCLDELRHGFYVLHDQVQAYSKVTSDRAASKRALQDHSLGHIRHCIDLLRQSLMCNADLTVELKDEQLGGVTGFGTVHHCVDWSELLDWMPTWEGIDAPPLAEVSHHKRAGV